MLVPQAAAPDVQQLVAAALQHHQAGRLPEAEQLYRRILQIEPRHAEALHLLGIVAHQIGRNDIAVELIGKAIGINGNEASFHYNLGNALKDLRHLEKAAAYGAAIRIKPDYPIALSSLGNALHGLRRLDEAAALHRAALCIKPDLPETHYNLGIALYGLGRLDEAVAVFRAALRIRPDFAETQANLGNAFLAQGNLEDAVAAYRQALRHRQDYAEAEMNLAFTQLYRSGVGLSDILRRARAWNQAYAARLERTVHQPPSHPQRLPRIGFVSADFRCHAVGLLVVPAIEGLAQAGYHLTCYSNSALTDELTSRFVTASTVWRPVAGMSDDSLADLIRSDGIDILIDLSGYSAQNRLLVFARKPAPLQVASWVGYPATTGMPVMDYILADRWQIPPGAEEFYTEAVIRLPDGYITFEPPADALPIGDLPALSQGGITFGSFNVLKKITPEVVAVWSRILNRLPTSRLIMKTVALSGSGARRRYSELFAAQGIAAERLRLIGGTSPSQHMAWMGQTDIALDSFPYAGGRTTLEALWMGLPVITLPGETFGSRHSLSYLSNIGLHDMAAADIDHYVELAVTLANDLPRLADLRAGMRQRMMSSPLCDSARFTGNLATALDTIWRRWCDGHPATSFDVMQKVIKLGT